MKKKPIHYIMWQIGMGGAELSVVHYINRFNGERELNTYSLRPIHRKVYDENKIFVRESSEYSWKGYLEYFHYCRKFRHHLFHLLNVGPVILFLTLIAGNKSPIYHIHGTLHWRKPYQKWYLRLFWWLSSWFSFRIIANSKHAASIFQKEVLPLNLKIIYNGIDVLRFTQKRHQRTALNKMAYIGRLQNGKNVDKVIELFESVAIEFPALELHIAGDGPLSEELTLKAMESLFSKRIFFHGYVEDIASFYESVDLFVFLSAHESFGNVLVEALLTGLPVLTSNVPAFEEIHGGEALFILGDPDEFLRVKEKFQKTIRAYPALAAVAYEKSHSLANRFGVEQHLTKIEPYYN